MAPVVHAEESPNKVATEEGASDDETPDTVAVEAAVTVVTAPSESGASFDRERTIHTLDQAALMAAQIDDGVAAAALVPGVSLQRTNRGAGTPLIRGFVGPHNLVFVDDVCFDL